MVFCPIASGSNGNCIYFGTENTHLLIDAGLSGASAQKGMVEIGVSPESIDGIFVTHEHSDHIQGVGVLSRRYDVPIFATEKTWLRMDRHNMIGKIQPHNKRVIYAGEPCIVNDICLIAFDIPHDSAQPVGYTAYADGFKLSVATDIGHVTDEIRESIHDSDLILLESNHDIEMLQNGPYPKELKLRVAGSKGHLSNVSAGQLLSEVMTERLKYIYLGHLSEENNRPLIALDTVQTILSANCNYTQYKLIMANRGYISEKVVL